MTLTPPRTLKPIKQWKRNYARSQDRAAELRAELPSLVAQAGVSKAEVARVLGISKQALHDRLKKAEER